MIILTSDITGVDIVTTYKTLVFVAGAIALIWGFVKTVREISKPLADLKRTVENHSSQIKELEAHNKKIDEGMAIMQQSLLQIMNHMIDGNHTDKLVKARDDMQIYLTKK